MIITVSEFTRRAKSGLIRAFPDYLQVEGEISGLSRPASGHVYMSLKDSLAQVSIVIWRSTVRNFKATLKNGQKVIVSGKIDLYAPRGSYNIVANRVERVGVGDIQEELERLKVEMQPFFERTKRAIPKFPKKIGLVTSSTGAAVKDYLKTAESRWPAEIVVSHTCVQGDEAEKQIARAIRAVQNTVDYIVVTRGGGSAEDLWAFNEREVLEAINKCPVPVVSAVGHEVDSVLSDFAADLRVATPTAAAQLLPSYEFLNDLISGYLSKMDHALGDLVRICGLQADPILADTAFKLYLNGKADEVCALQAKLEGYNPKNLLAAGYSIATRDYDGTVIHDAMQVPCYSLIRIDLEKGYLLANVKVRIPENGTDIRDAVGNATKEHAGPEQGRTDP